MGSRSVLIDMMADTKDSTTNLRGLRIVLACCIDVGIVKVEYWNLRI